MRPTCFYWPRSCPGIKVEPVWYTGCQAFADSMVRIITTVIEGYEKADQLETEPSQHFEHILWPTRPKARNQQIGPLPCCHSWLPCRQNPCDPALLPQIVLPDQALPRDN